MLIWLPIERLDWNDRHGRRCCISLKMVEDRLVRSSSRNLLSTLRMALWMNGIERRGSILYVVLRFLKNSFAIFLLCVETLKINNKISLNCNTINIKHYRNLSILLPNCYFYWHFFYEPKSLTFQHLLAHELISILEDWFVPKSLVLFLSPYSRYIEFHLFYKLKYIRYSYIINPTHKIT